MLVERLSALRNASLGGGGRSSFIFANRDPIIMSHNSHSSSFISPMRQGSNIAADRTSPGIAIGSSSNALVGVGISSGGLGQMGAERERGSNGSVVSSIMGSAGGIGGIDAFGAPVRKQSGLGIRASAGGYGSGGAPGPRFSDSGSALPLRFSSPLNPNGNSNSNINGMRRGVPGESGQSATRASLGGVGGGASGRPSAAGPGGADRSSVDSAALASQGGAIAAAGGGTGAAGPATGLPQLNSEPGAVAKVSTGAAEVGKASPAGKHSTNGAKVSANGSAAAAAAAAPGGAGGKGGSKAAGGEGKVRAKEGQAGADVVVVKAGGSGSGVDVSGVELDEAQELPGRKAPVCCVIS